MFAMLTASISIYLGPIYIPETFQPLPAPWSQLNLAIGVFCLTTLLINAILVAGKVLITIKSITLRNFSKLQLVELDKELLIEMYNCYPIGIEVSRLSHEMGDLKPIHIKSSLGRLVAAGYVKEPFLLGPYTISEAGIKKAEELIRLLKQFPKK